ncbi:MAG: MYG1 family protein [Cellulosilyticaceae bacterium]
MKKMAVHNGVFHADDVFCVALMQSIEENLKVVRTRDEAILATCDLVADVGNGSYDHHQADKTLRVDGIPYSAFGLLWGDFGLKFVQKQCPHIAKTSHAQEIVALIASEFITQIDAGDNGVNLNTYVYPVTTLSQIISGFMPLEREVGQMDDAFFNAVVFAKTILKRTVYKYAKMYDDLDYIEKCLKKEKNDDNHILVLEKDVKWKDSVLSLDVEQTIWFVVFQDITGSWRVQTVPKAKDSFESRRDLPKAWGGMRGEELTKLTGIPNCIFCHPNLFIGGNETQEGAIEMAKLAVEACRKDVIMC